MHAEIDDMLHQAKNSEEKAKKAMVDAARLADELRAEQEHASSQEKAKRSLESSIAELDQRLAEANDIAAKGGRNAMAKLESRIRELEIELGSCQSKTSENYKAFQKAERRIKELQFQQDEDHKNQDRMGELANKLQSKIKTYKKQIEEAEELAALNLAKFRKLNKSLRRLKRGLRWLELNFLLSAKPLLPCKLAFVDSTSSLPVFPYHQQQVAYSMFTLFINHGIIIAKYSSYSIMNKEYY